jgi:hypothetical protein
MAEWPGAAVPRATLGWLASLAGGLAAARVRCPGTIAEAVAMRMRRAFNIAAAAVVCCTVLPVAAKADNPVELVQSIERSIATAGKFVRDKKFDEATAALDEAKTTFEALSAVDIPESLRPKVDALQKRLAAAERAVARRKDAPVKATSAARKNAGPASSNPAKAKRPAKVNEAAKPPPPPSFTGRPEDVQFLRDLAPILVANCIGCHGGARPAGRLRLETFASLSDGGKSGRVIEPGRPSDSLLVKKLRGIGGERMPKDKPPLSPEAIARFEAWIKAGASFEGTDPALSLKEAIEKSVIARMPHDELTIKRLAQAEKIWALAALDKPAEQLQTANFILLGNVSPERLAEVARLVEVERAKIVKLLKLDGGAPLVKGGLVLFALKRSSDYSQFVRLVEGREATRGAIGHGHAKGWELYASLVASSDSDDILPALVAEQAACGLLLSFNNVPPWFATGAARAIAARVEPKNPLVKKWDVEAENLPAAGDADSLLSATDFNSETAARSYAFVRALTSKLPQFQALVAALGQEQDFDQSLTDVYRHDGRALVELWLRRKPSAR